MLEKTNNIANPLVRSAMICDFLKHSTDRTVIAENPTTPRDLYILLGAPQYEELRKNIKKFLNGFIYDKLQPTAQGIFDGSANPCIFIEKFNSLDSSLQKILVATGLIKGLTNADAVGWQTIPDAIRAQYMQALEQLENDTEEPRPNTPTADVFLNQVAINSVLSGWSEPLQSKTADGSDGKTANGTPTATDNTADTGTHWGGLGLPDIPTPTDNTADNTADTGTHWGGLKMTADTEKPTPAPELAQKLAQMPKESAYIVYYYCDKVAKKYAERLRNGDTTPPESLLIEFDARKIAKANNIPIGGKTLAEIEKGVGPLLNTLIEFVQFEGVEKGKSYRKLYKTRFITSIETKQTADEKGIIKEHITAVRIDPYFIKSLNLPRIPAGKLFNGGAFRGALLAGELGAVYQFIINRYPPKCFISWEILDKFAITDKKTRRVKEKLLKMFTDNGFDVERVGVDGFKFHPNQGPTDDTTTPKRRGRPRKTDAPTTPKRPRGRPRKDPEK